MKQSTWTQKIYSFLVAAQQWYLQTPERALDEAYKAALLIKAMEDEHFNGRKILAESASYGDSTMAYFQSELQRYLKIVRMRLTEFKASRSFVGGSNQKITKLARNNGTNTAKDSFAIQTRNNPSLVLEKLRFIDEVIARYTIYERTSSSVAIKPELVRLEESLPPTKSEGSTVNKVDKGEERTESVADETGILPRSILRTINRIKVELDPKAEEELVRNFRSSKKKTVISVRFILLLILLPLLTQQLSKNLIVGPIVDRLKNPRDTKIFLNFDMEGEALSELQRFADKLNFQNLISETPTLSPKEIQEQLKDKAREIEDEYRSESSNAIKNVFADLLSLAVFTWVIFISKREIAVLKDFMDEIVYGLSDSAKAFIIILFTDIFVGFHSPHGWEVLLSSLSRHFGLPENHDFIFLFIATFPVILDTVFKYWIFRYLNRISPSAVATYRNMNE